MLAFSILALLCGMVLGQRLKVLALAPASLVLLLLVIVIGIARADTFWHIGLMAAAGIGCLQIGYLAGIGIRHILVLARASRLHPAPIPRQQARRSAH